LPNSDIIYLPTNITAGALGGILLLSIPFRVLLIPFFFGTLSLMILAGLEFLSIKSLDLTTLQDEEE